MYSVYTVKCTVAARLVRAAVPSTLGRYESLMYGTHSSARYSPVATLVPTYLVGSVGRLMCVAVFLTGVHPTTKVPHVGKYLPRYLGYVSKYLLR